MSDALRVRYGGLTIDYSQMANTDLVNQVVLWAAEQEGLLEYLGSTPQGYYLVLVNGADVPLTAVEVPSFVLGLFAASGRDITPVAYRIGLRDTSGDRQDHDS